MQTFEEKPQLQKSWINGGFFVLKKKFIDFIAKKDVQIEREPLIKAAKKRIYGL